MVTRREALQRVGLGGVAVFVGSVPGLRAIATPLPVRREITTLALSDPIVQTLRDGVKILKNRGPGQGPSWTDFSNMHGNAATFNKCPHGNWYFLPWHRAYLLSYERMIRAVTSNSSFAMPYWDWAAHRTVPQAFADSTYNGQSNPLYVGTRNNAYSVPDIYSGPSVMNDIFTQTNFELFASSRPAGQNNTNASWIKASGTQGKLEYTPHNHIHTNLGGFMPNGNSPMDPIFLMHHGNIDRIWWSWNCRGHANTSDPLWLNMSFTNNYYNPDGTWATYKPVDLQSVGALGYSYGLCLRRLAWPYLRQLANVRLADIFKRGRAVDSAAGVRAFELRSELRGPALEAVGAAPPRTLSNTFSNLKLQRPMAQIAADQRTSQIVALIHNLTPPDDRVEVLVFASRGALPATLDPKDRTFVSAIGFFGAHAHGHAGVDASVDLTEHLRALPGTGDQIHVRLVARPIEGGEAEAQSTVAQAQVEVVIA